jgi:hypothetical protein
MSAQMQGPSQDTGDRFPVTLKPLRDKGHGTQKSGVSDLFWLVLGRATGCPMTHVVTA